MPSTAAARTARALSDPHVSAVPGGADARVLRLLLALGVLIPAAGEPDAGAWSLAAEASRARRTAHLKG